MFFLILFSEIYKLDNIKEEDIDKSLYINMKNIYILTIFVTLLITTSVYASRPNVVINGNRVNFQDQGPIIQSGRTLVPVRGVFEELGFDVSWNASTSTATISNEKGTAIFITSGQNTFRMMDGRIITPDVPQQIINGRFMLPLRAISESIGIHIDWEPDSATVTMAWLDFVPNEPINQNDVVQVPVQPPVNNVPNQQQPSVNNPRQINSVSDLTQEDRNYLFTHMGDIGIGTSPSNIRDRIELNFTQNLFTDALFPSGLHLAVNPENLEYYHGMYIPIGLSEFERTRRLGNLGLRRQENNVPPTNQNVVATPSVDNTVVQNNTTTNDRTFEQRVFELTNEYRVQNGLQPFIWRDDLATVARNFSRDLVLNNMLSHTSPDGSNVSQRLQRAGISFTGWAENIATHPTPEATVQAWINSEGHRRNLLSNHRYLGVGFYTNGIITRTTQKFIN